mgnify:FL=1
MKHPRRSIPLLCLAILLGSVALGAAAHAPASVPSSRPSQAADAVHTLHQLLGSAQVDAILSGQQPTALEDLDTSQLEALFNALGDEESYSLEESEQAGAIQAKIAAILNLRTQDLPPETTPVTLERLLRTTEDRIATCQVLLSLPPMDPAELDQDAAIQTQEEANQKIQAQLDRLLSFQERLQQEATEENAYDLWCVLWDDILQEPQPTLAAPEA